MKKLFFMMCFLMLSISVSVIAQTSVPDDNLVQLEEPSSSQDVVLQMTSIDDVKIFINSNIEKLKDKTIKDVGKLVSPSITNINKTINTNFEKYYCLVNDVGKEKLSEFNRTLKKKDYSLINKLLSYNNNVK